MIENNYEEAAERLRTARKAIALTGAGASVESGIPDFRSAGGLWEVYPPEEYATILSFIRDPVKVWSLWFALGDMMKNVTPNPGHFALAELEKRGHLHAIVTQNIDNLHQAAGNSKVIEYHGNAQRLYCLHCGTRRPLDLAGLNGRAPECECEEVMKPDVVLFGESIPKHALYESEILAQTCDVIIVVGTSAQVFPAAGIPYTAKENGAYVIECNVEPTDFTETVTDTFLRGPAGQTLPRLVAQLESR
jgi:NAD-dependent deacetylase